jgi:hypothetical protein
MVCMFMCKVSTNGIHVSTSHTIHFFYYGFGFVPLVFFWHTPEHEFLIAIAALLTLVIYSVSRRISLPNYPMPWQVTRLYKLNDVTGEWELSSVPKTRFGLLLSSQQEPQQHQSLELPSMANAIAAVGEIDGNETSIHPFKWALAFPTYEILNAHISSSFTIGILSGLATSNIVGASGGMDAKIVSNESLAISVSVATVVIMAREWFGLYGAIENKMHKMVLANFWPKSVAVVLGMLGAAAIVVQLDPDASADDGSTVITYWVGIGALVTTISLTFVESSLAKIGHTVKSPNTNNH